MTTAPDKEQLFRSNYQGMLKLAVALLHDVDAARDIVHDVFASLLSGNVSSVTPAYLLSGVRFACLKHLRDLSTRERLNRLYALDLDEIENEEWPDDEDITLLNRIVDECLPEKTRTIVRLRFGRRMRYAEIAEELSISEVSVFKHLRHAINVLRQHFKDHGE